MSLTPYESKPIITYTPLHRVKTCRKPELGDYIAYFLADLGEKALQGVLDAEAEKSYEKSDAGVQALSILGKLICGLAKIEINSDLCVPIENPTGTYLGRA